MKILIIGYAQSGKDTVAEYISLKYKIPFVSSSIIAAENIIMKSLKNTYKNKYECYLDRINNRSIWYNLISEYCKENPTRHVENVLSVSDIYVGLRSRREFNSSISKDLFDIIIWIDKECAFEDEKSMELNKEDAHIIITNNKTLEDLYKKIDQLFCLFDDFLLMYH